jgi:TolB-like protein/Tfp pilus assembly protein PilF
MTIYEFGPFSFHTADRLLLREGHFVPLKPKILDLLLVLVENRGHIVEKDVLMKQVWPDSFVEENNLAVGISALRKVLGEGSDGQAYIENIPRRGYRFVAPVAIVAQPSEQLTTPTNLNHQDLPRTSIAVLPFKHMGSREDEEYLGLGITDALITRLSNVRQVIVRPTSAVRKYQDVLDPIAVGQELRVESVLDGSIQRSGQRIRVTVQLISVSNGAALWAAKFDEQFTDIFEVEDSISEQMTKALTLKLTSEEKVQLIKHHTEDSKAYQAYLRGRYFCNKRTPDDFKRAIECFQQAIVIDPNYALAYSGLADCYMHASSYNAVPPKEYIPKAEEAALKALEIDDTLAEAHLALGYHRIQIWDWSEAEKECKRAIELNPNYADAHRRYSTYLEAVGRLDDAKAEIKITLEIDPISLVFNTSLGFLFYLDRQPDQAIEQFLEVLELAPSYGPAHFFLGLAYVQKQMYDEAIAEYKKTVSLLGTDIEGLGYIGHTLAICGRLNEAYKVLDELLELSKRRYVEPYFLALIYTALDDKDRAFVWLEKGYQDHISTMGILKVDPMLDSLRDDPRFESLLQRMGLMTDNTYD